MLADRHLVSDNAEIMISSIKNETIDRINEALFSIMLINCISTWHLRNKKKKKTILINGSNTFITNYSEKSI